MLSRQITRLGAPIVARQSAVRTSSMTLKACTQRAPLSTRAGLLATPVTLKVDGGASAGSSSSGSGSSSSTSSSTASPAVLRVAAVTAIGVIGALMLEASKEGEMDSAFLAEMHTQLRLFGSRFGLTASQCDAAAAEVRGLPAGVPLSSLRVNTAIANLPVVTDELPLASMWRRFFAFLADCVVLQTALMGAAMITARLKPGFDLQDGSMKTVLANLVVNLLYNFAFLVSCNGQTLGKKLLGLRVCRVDLGDLDSVTVAKLVMCQTATSVAAGAIELGPLLFEGPRANSQLLHNVVSGTKVVSTTPAEVDEE